MLVVKYDKAIDPPLALVLVLANEQLTILMFVL
jgi:hypothetical protein